MENQRRPNPRELAGASVLVAGANGGLGSAISEQLHRRGAVLTLVGRRAEPLAELDVPGQRLQLDLRSPDACQQAVTSARAQTGRLDVVVNAVGVVAFGPVSDLSLDTLEELFLTNTFVPIMLAKASLSCLDPRGVIVNISGVIAEKNLPGMAVYGASKAALSSFDQAFAREARRAKVTVLDARPPHTETGLAQRPIEGIAPSMAIGLEPARVAEVICDAIEQGATDLPSSDF